ncbi:glycine zipper 2TM domain-containing protein [Uliginosibacterium sp. sgz301328]|uniref:glycine zipper 2TM domain-containing protein n=1 Tax=Uliginosibacterium sp. sgz301328 TaxID=3243764 RepID=UPI00359E1CEC
MAISFRSRFAALLAALAVAACAAPNTQQDRLMIVRQGVIEQITPTQIQSTDHMGVGAVVGGIAGAGLGSLMGSGTGRDVAMVAGAIGGTVAGAEAQRRFETPMSGQQIFVRLGSGVLIEITQPTDLNLRVGQNVFVQGNGQAARVIPQ